MELRIYFEWIRARFWVLPSLIVVSLLGLFFIVLNIPSPKGDGFLVQTLFKGYSVESARLILQSMATAMMTVISVLFSVTIVVLQQVSVQYSPRVVENFIKATSSQVMLGLYVGTFFFCLLLLRQMPNPGIGPQDEFPQVAVTSAITLALLCIALLIHYIDHLANSIRSTSIIVGIRDEAIHYIGGLIQDENGRKIPPRLDNAHELELRAVSAGYFQSFLSDKIIRTLKGVTWEVRLQYLPGDYVEVGERYAVVRLSAPLTENRAKKLHSHFNFGPARTHAQDVRYGIRQLIDIALRALSPGINDPTTAIESFQGVGTVLLFYFKNETRIDRSITCNEGEIKTIQPSGREILELAFNQIILSAKDHPDIAFRILRTLGNLRDVVQDQGVLGKLNELYDFTRSQVRSHPGYSLYSNGRIGAE